MIALNNLSMLSSSYLILAVDEVHPLLSYDVEVGLAEPFSLMSAQDLKCDLRQKPKWRSAAKADGQTFNPRHAVSRFHATRWCWRLRAV